MPRRFLMTDEIRTPRLAEWIGRTGPDTGIIFRHYGVPDRESLALKVASLANAMGRPFLVAGDVRLALRCGATGVHLPEWAVRCPPSRKLLGKCPLVTAAAHSLGALLRAAAIGCNAVLLGPVYATESHPEARPLGAARASAIAMQSPIAVYVLGGVTESRWRLLQSFGFAGYAAIGAFAEGASLPRS